MIVLWHILAVSVVILGGIGIVAVLVFLVLIELPYRRSRRR